MNARTAGVFYLLVFITGTIAVVTGDSVVVAGNVAATANNILTHESVFRLSWVINVLSAACYVVVTAIFYMLFKAVNATISLTAAFLSLTGCIVSAAQSLFRLAPLAVLKSPYYTTALNKDQRETLAYALLRLTNGNTSLVFFGFYCVLIGWLITKSTFLPHLLGAGMIIAGLGWLTFLWPPLDHLLSPFNMLPGVLGEGALTLWLLVKGVNDNSVTVPNLERVHA
jgi:hypothetical protein